MERAEYFLDLFSKVEQYLKELLDVDYYMSFYKMVEKLSYKNNAIKHYEIELKEYGDLRNAIIHERINQEIIAVPNEYAIKEFEMICEKIVKPRAIFSIINHKVIQIQYDEMLSAALKLMNTENISQVPVYDNGYYKGTINSRGITSWITHNMTEESINIRDIKIKDVLAYDDQLSETKFLPKEASIYELYHIFMRNIRQKNHIESVIITENGGKDEYPITIVTGSDLPMIFDYL